MGKAIVSAGQTVELRDGDATFDKNGRLLTAAKVRSIPALTEFEADDKTIEALRGFGSVMTEEQADAYRKAEEERRNAGPVAIKERVYGGALEGHRIGLNNEAGTVFEGAADATMANKNGTQEPVEEGEKTAFKDDQTGQAAAAAQRAAADRAAADKAAADKAAAERAAADKAAQDKAAADKAAADKAAADKAAQQNGNGQNGQKSDPLA